jgi:SAM-dependent methyltransferase
MEPRHEKTGQWYGSGGELERWCDLPGTKAKLERLMDLVARVVEGDLLLQIPPDQKLIIFSVSANKGEAEDRLQERLGKRAQVIAGDLADCPKPAVEERKAAHLQGNALALPVEGGSVHAIVDFRGALWVECQFRRQEILLREYRRAMAPGGLLIIDDESVDDKSIDDNNGNHRLATGPVLDMCYPSGAPNGFELAQVLGNTDRIRVYQKNI